MNSNVSATFAVSNTDNHMATLAFNDFPELDRLVTVIRNLENWQECRFEGTVLYLCRQTTGYVNSWSAIERACLERIQAHIDNLGEPVAECTYTSTVRETKRVRPHRFPQIIY